MFVSCIVSDVQQTDEYLHAHHIDDGVVRYLTEYYIEELMMGTPLEQWYHNYKVNPIISWHERRLHLSNAIRLAILYHKGDACYSCSIVLLK